MVKRSTVLKTPPSLPVGVGGGALVVTAGLGLVVTAVLGLVVIAGLGFAGLVVTAGLGFAELVVVTTGLGLVVTTGVGLVVTTGVGLVVRGGIEGMEVGLSKQTSELPWLTVNTGVTLPIPLESPRTITTSVPAGIVT
jgi:hypothetical protein